MSNSAVVQRLALQAEAALAQLLIQQNADLGGDDKRKLEVALAVVRMLAS